MSKDFVTDEIGIIYQIYMNLLSQRITKSNSIDIKINYFNQSSIIIPLLITNTSLLSLITSILIDWSQKVKLKSK